MRFLAKRFVVAAAFVVCFGTSTTLLAQVQFTLVHVNDTHSHLDATGPKDAQLNGTTGGMAKAASLIGYIKATEPNVLTLHAGDAFHGSLFFNAYFGVPELQLMASLGFDAMAVGNHEFDLGPDTLAYILYNAFPPGQPGALPLLSANIDLSAHPYGLDNWIQPSIIKEVGGVKVGIFGMTVPTNPTTNNGDVAILGGDDPVKLMQIAGYQMQVLRLQGCQVVIMLSHLGTMYDEAVAANVPGIDIIVSAHDHYAFAQPLQVANPYGQKVLIVEAGTQYQHVGSMHFTLGPTGVTLDDYTLLDVDATVPAAPQVQGVVNYLKYGIMAQYGDVYYTPVAYATADVKYDYDPIDTTTPKRDTAMGNLITDAYRAKTHTDVAITPNGLISEGLSHGYIVAEDLFRPVSYGYDTETGLGLKMATFDMMGYELVKGLEVGLAYYGINQDFFLQASGITFKFDPRRPVGQRVMLPTLRINGQKLNPYKKYSVTVNTGVVYLLPLLGVTVTNLQFLPDLEYSVLKSYVSQLGLVSYKSQGRIKDVSLDD
ncbi:MAG TPA: 5'-nucleotidase C-terminal domain-containing protein [Polyangia bacterium]